MADRFKDLAPRSPRAKGLGKDVELDSRVQDHIGRNLKKVYQQVADEPVPDKFMALLEQLDKEDCAE